MAGYFLYTFLIYIGTSGYSYDDWRGNFYPPHLDKNQMFDFYSHRFLCVEINSSFYTMPSRKMISTLLNKSPQQFKFTVKAYKSLTHSNTIDSNEINAFANAVRTLYVENKLGCILAQFPWSFKKSPENIDKIKIIKDGLNDIPLVLEFRNNEWIDEGTFIFLKNLQIGFCCVDEPNLPGLIPPVTVSTSSIGYIRFHGRNSKEWWNSKDGWQRYNYSYSENELLEWIPRINQISKNTEETYVFFNNHYGGKAATNAGMLARMMNIRLPFADEEIYPKNLKLFSDENIE